MELKCTACASEYVAATQQVAKGIPTEVIEPEDAVTLAPTWINNTVQGQVIVAAVAVPTCYRHMMVEEESELQKALRSGILLGGNGIGNVG